jgi:hypothetical protein
MLGSDLDIPSRHATDDLICRHGHCFETFGDPVRRGWNDWQAVGPSNALGIRKELVVGPLMPSRLLQ